MVRDNHNGNHNGDTTARERRRSRKEALLLLFRKRTTNGRNVSIRNFRPVSGFECSRVYRCGSTDVLGARIQLFARKNNNNLPLVSCSSSVADGIVSKDAGLVIDLRSPPERNEANALLWMNEATKYNNNNNGEQQHQQIICKTIPVAAVAGEVAIDESFFGGTEGGVENSRFVIRLDVLHRNELLNYAREKWLLVESSSSSSPQQRLLSLSTIEKEAANTIMTELNKRGLAGLNEAILETKSGQTGMCRALQLMTLYREALAEAVANKNRSEPQNSSSTSSSSSNDDDGRKDAIAHDPGKAASIVFHCVQGKDRTGMLAMLMQLLMGCSDETIVEDYYRSNAEYLNSSNKDPSAAASAMTTTDLESLATKSDNTISTTPPPTTTTKLIRMDKNVFRGTNRPSMVSTLQGLRSRHGKRFPYGYFDRIGFDASWRKRFETVFVVGETARERVPSFESSGGGKPNQVTHILPKSRL